MAADGNFLAPGGARMRLEPAILPAFLSADECSELKAYSDRMKRARLSGGTFESAVRAASSCWLDEDELPWLSLKLVRGVAEVARDHFPFTLNGFDEGFQLLRYDGATGDHGGDFYDWHVDIGRSGSTVSRKLSLVVQLSDPADYEGGALELNMDGTTRVAPAEQGTLIAFPSYALHHVAPVTKGTRYSLAIWVHGPAFR